jgi:parallel beta-helix repeat protein
LQLEPLEDRLAPATLTVTTTADETVTNDAPSVSLREAILSINNQADTGADVTANRVGAYGVNDTINFMIPGAGVKTISVGSSLPAITMPVVIDGTSQPGFTNSPIVVLNGAGAGGNANGLDIELGSNVFTSGVTVKGLVINQFSGNGIKIGPANLSSGSATTQTTIQGNYIGTDATGSSAAANGANGILINGVDSDNLGIAASNNVISGNVIAGNTNDGVLIQANANGVASGNTITGNFIGINAAGTAALHNGVTGSLSQTGSSGVEIISASGNTVGGTGPAALTTQAGAGNVISGNASDGVHVIGTLTDPAGVNVVLGNFIGATPSGVAAQGNARYGIEVSGAKNSSVGRNVVGANLAGIVLDNGAQNNFIQGNFVGVGGDGVTAVGNTQQGIALRSNDAAAPPLGPGQPNEPGVQNNLIGGLAPVFANTVAFNGSAGIAVFGNPLATSGDQNSGNTIEGNSIFQNGRSSTTTPLLGIDLSNGFPFPKDDGFTANDSKGHGAANDPNNFQNFPAISSVSFAGGLTIQGSLTEPGEANTTFRIEFFANNPDPLGLPAEGQFFLGSANVTTNGSGTASFTVTLPVQFALGQILTATATSLTKDPLAPAGQPGAGNTSEFSPGFAGPAVSPSSANQFFVAKVYGDLLARFPDPGGFAAWTSQLDKGVPRAQVVLAIETAPGNEYYTNLVQSFYPLYVHRPQGPGEAPGVVNFLAGGGRIELLRAMFTSSLEYQLGRSNGSVSGYVNAVYQDAFGTPNRTATDPGAAAFAAALGGGSLTPAQFSNIIFNSDEFRTVLVQSFYQKFLHRTGAAGEINGWATLLKQGVSDQVVIASILGSLEAFGALPPNPPTALPPLNQRTVTTVNDGLFGPIFANIPLNGRANLNSLDVFRSPGDPQPPNPDAANFGNTVLIATISPFAGVLTPTSFDPTTTLDINAVNVNGHLNPDFTFRFTFATPTPAGNTFNQVVTLRLIQGNTTTTIAQYTFVGNQVIPPAAFANNITFPGDAIATGRFIAGNFDDPSFMDAQGLSDFAKTGLNPSNPATPFPRPSPLNAAHPALTEAKNFFGGANTLAVMIEVPTTKLTTANPPLLGAWATSAVNGVQVQRVGRPLVDALLIPPVPRNEPGVDRRTAFNQGSPSTDVANFRADMLSVLKNPNFIYQRSQAQAVALTDSVFGSTILGANTGLLPDVLTLDLSKQYLAAGNGFPNGRLLRDDVASTLLRQLTGNAAATDNVADDNGIIITDGLGGVGASVKFPYIGRPNGPASGPNL